MGTAPAVCDHFAFNKCFGESPLRECRSRKRDNFVLIEVDTEDFGDVIVLDVPESFQKQFKKKPKHVISLDDDDDDDSGGNRDGVCRANSDVATSDRCSPREGSHPSTSASTDEDVNEGNTPVKLSKSKRTYSGKNMSTDQYGLSSDSEGWSSESDCSDCELIEGSSEKLREQWEKASFRRRRDTSCVPPDIGNKVGTSAQSVYENAEEGSSEDLDPPGEQSRRRDSSLHHGGDNGDAGATQTFSQKSSEQHDDPMEMDEQSSRMYENFVSSGLNNKDNIGTFSRECPSQHSVEQCVDKTSERVGNLDDCGRNLAEQFKVPGQRCDAKTPNEVFSRNYSAYVTKEPSQVVESNHDGLLDRQGAAIPSTASDLKSSCGVNLCSGEYNIIIDRQKMKETEEYKRALEEELAARKQQLLLQADEAQRLRNRKRAEKIRLMTNERRQKERVEEVRNARRKDEENLNLKEKHRAEIKKELRMIEAICFDMASLLRRLGIHVGGGMFPSPNEVQAAYKRACLKFHPDRISTTDLRQQVEAEEKFKLISNMKDKFLLK